VFLGITSLQNGRIDIGNVEYLSEKDFKKWTRRVTPRPGDIVFSYETKLGEAAIIPQGLRCCLGRRMALMRPHPFKVDGRFLLYYYLGPEFQDVIRERTIHGSTVDRIALIEFPKFPVRLPDLDQQRAIAHILGTLDDKLELNRKMNETLEAMARALFKSWFVDFDPVRAKAAVRREHPRWADAEVCRAALPTLSPEIAALFPDSFEETPLGAVPTGWAVEPIGKLTDVIGGTTPSTKVPEYWAPGTHAWATPKDLSNLQTPVLLKTDRRVSDVGLAQIGSGLLPAGTVLLSSRAPIGYLAVAEIPVAINQGFIAMKPKEGVSNLFLLYWAEVAQETIKSRANGSTFLEISKSNFRQIDIVRPDTELMKKFDEYVRPWYERIVANEHETASLVTMRDALLPKLISGEIRVGPAEVE
jgi:type I restriction enzyme S subunit